MNSGKELKAGIRSHELKQSQWGNGVCRFVLMVYSIFFLMWLRITTKYSTISSSWVLLQLLSIFNKEPIHSHNCLLLIWWSHLLSWESLFQYHSTLCQNTNWCTHVCMHTCTHLHTQTQPLTTVKWSLYLNPKATFCHPSSTLHRLRSHRNLSGLTKGINQEGINH